MPAKVPAWLQQVRDAHRAVMAAETAVMEEFPLQSQWVCDGCRVVVTGPGENVGDVWVCIAGRPAWMRRVAAAALSPLPAAKEDAHAT